MLQHPAELIREVHEEDFQDQRVDLQSECLKSIILADGVVDVGRGITDKYTLQAVIEDYQGEGLTKALAAFAMAFSAKEPNALQRMSAVKKLERELDKIVDEGMSFQAKQILGVS